MGKDVISQTEAKRLKARVAKLEADEDKRRNAWAQEWPDGVHLCSASTPTAAREVLTARKLGHAVVAVLGMNDRIDLIALPLAGVRP